MKKYTKASSENEETYGVCICRMPALSRYRGKHGIQDLQAPEMPIHISVPDPVLTLRDLFHGLL